MLDRSNWLVECQNFLQHCSSRLNVHHNCFDGPTKLFLDLYPVRYFNEIVLSCRLSARFICFFLSSLIDSLCFLLASWSVWFPRIKLVLSLNMQTLLLPVAVHLSSQSHSRQNSISHLLRLGARETSISMIMSREYILTKQTR